MSTARIAMPRNPSSTRIRIAISHSPGRAACQSHGQKVPTGRTPAPESMRGGKHDSRPFGFDAGTQSRVTTAAALDSGQGFYRKAVLAELTSHVGYLEPALVRRVLARGLHVEGDRKRRLTGGHQRLGNSGL